MSRGIVPAVPRGQQVVQGLLSGSVLLLVAVGIPVVLVLVGGSPLPHGLVHALRVDMSLRQLFARPVADSWIVHAAFALAWMAWLWLSICVVVEIAAWISGRTPVRVPGSRTMQALAACLVGTTLAVMVVQRMPRPAVHAGAHVSVAVSTSTRPNGVAARSSPTGSTRLKSRAMAPAPGISASGATAGRADRSSVGSAPGMPSRSASRPSSTSRPGESHPRPGVAYSNGSLPTNGPDDPASEGPPGGVGRAAVDTVAPAQEHSAQLSDMVVSVATPAMRTYVVQPHDTLWSIASSQLGSPLRWPEIAQANYDRPQPDGRALTDAHWIDPGWVLVLPPDAAVADTAVANPAPPQAVATPTPAPAESAPPPAASPPTAASPPAASPPTAASPPKDPSGPPGGSNIEGCSASRAVGAAFFADLDSVEGVCSLEPGTRDFGTIRSPDHQRVEWKRGRSARRFPAHSDRCRAPRRRVGRNHRSDASSPTTTSADG